MLDLGLIGQRVQRLKIGQADGAAFVRNINRRSGIRENSAPLDAHPEGVHAEIVAGQLRVGVVRDVGARPVLRNAVGDFQQLIDRVVHPLVPIGIGVHR
jgi:hypothetical protein